MQKSLHARNRANISCKKKLVLSLVLRGQEVFNVDCSLIFDAIMEVGYNSEYRQYYGQGLQVDNLLFQDKEFYQGAERFLEFCLSSDSSSAEIRELAAELVAAKRISKEDAERKLSVLVTKAQKLKTRLVRADQLKHEIKLAFLDSSEGITTEALDKLKLWLRCNIKIYKDFREIIRRFWAYFPFKARKSAEDLAYSFLDTKSQREEIAELVILCLDFSIPCSTKSISRVSSTRKLRKKVTQKVLHKSELILLFARCEGEISQLTNAILKVIDQKHPSEDWCDPAVMELFLDSLMANVGDDSSSLVPYTKEMDNDLEALLDGVEVD